MVDLLRYKTDWSEAQVEGPDEKGLDGKSFAVAIETHKPGSPKVLLGTLELQRDKAHLFAPSCLVLWIPVQHREDLQDWESRSAKHNAERLGEQNHLTLANAVDLNFGYTPNSDYQLHSWGGENWHAYFIRPTQERIANPDQPDQEVSLMKAQVPIDVFPIAWKHLVDIQLELL